jgi:hypothetical protein
MKNLKKKKEKLFSNDFFLDITATNGGNSVAVCAQLHRLSLSLSLSVSVSGSARLLCSLSSGLWSASQSIAQDWASIAGPPSLCCRIAHAQMLLTLPLLPSPSHPRSPFPCLQRPSFRPFPAPELPVPSSSVILQGFTRPAPAFSPMLHRETAFLSLVPAAVCGKADVNQDRSIRVWLILRQAGWRLEAS